MNDDWRSIGAPGLPQTQDVDVICRRLAVHRNEIVSPLVTLSDVAKPWLVGAPLPVICQSLVGSPGKLFSHAMTLTTGGPQGPARAGDRCRQQRHH